MTRHQKAGEAHSSLNKGESEEYQFHTSSKSSLRRLLSVTQLCLLPIVSD